MSNFPVIGVIEWASDSARTPAVFVGDSAEQVRAAAVELLWPMIELEEIGYVDDEWAAAHPKPDMADSAAVATWLGELREQTTDAWLEIYTRGAETSGDEYADLRV